MEVNDLLFLAVHQKKITNKLCGWLDVLWHGVNFFFFFLFYIFLYCCT